MATMTEKVKTVREIAGKNKISLNKRFTESYIAAHAMYEGPAALADRIVSGMWDICRHGINNGFDGTCCSTLDKLSDIVAALTELDSEQVGKLTKYTVKADELLQAEREERKSAINVAQPVYKCIESCSDAVEVLTELRKTGKGFANIDESQFKLLSQSKKILGEIAAALDGAFDTSSRSAQQKADAVIECLQSWRDDCVRLVCTGASVEKLNSAKELVTEWSKLSEEVTRRERAKEQHEWNDDDELGNISSSKHALEMLDTFVKRMESEKADIAAAKAKIAERDRAKAEHRDELSAALDELEKQKAAIITDAQNGADVKLCNRKIKEIKAKMDDVYFEIGKLDEKGMPDFIRSEVESREAIHAALERVTEILSGSQNDLGFLAETVRDVDFNALIDMLGGRTSKQSMKDALESINYICAGISEKLDNRKKTVQVLGDNANIIREVLDIPAVSRNDVIDRVRASQRKYDDELDEELLAALGGAKTGETGEKTADKAKKNIALSDDDR